MPVVLKTWGKQLITLVILVVPCLAVPVVLKTWGKQTTNIEYYSEEADDSIPTVDLGVSNQNSGKWNIGEGGRER